MLRFAFFAIIFILSFFSLLIYKKLIENKRICIINSFSWIRVYFYLSGVIIFVLSSLKCYLGSYNISLYQSFWDILPATFQHYLPILVTIAILIPIVVYWLARILKRDFIGYTISLVAISLFVCFLLFGTVTNRSYVFIFILCHIVSFIVTLSRKVHCEYYQLSEYKQCGKEWWCISFLFCFINLFYFPNELYLSNIEGFYNSYFSFVIILLGGTLLGFAFLQLSIMLLPKSWTRMIVCFIFSLEICFYIQGMFLNGKLSSMQGFPEDWPLITVLGNVLIWCFVIIFTVGIGYWKKKALYVYNYISLFLVLVLSSTLIVLVLQNASELNNNNKGLSSKGALELGKEENVVVFVLDMTDATVVEKIFEDEPEFAMPLKDFTFYNNCVSLFSNTRCGIPYLLTGTKWDGNNGTYDQYAYGGENTFLKKLKMGKVQFDIYSSAEYIDESYYSLIDNYSEQLSFKSIITNTITTMWRTSMYKASPLFLKIKYYYFSDNIEAMVDVGNKWSTDNDIYFYNMIKENGIKVSNNSRVFKFYHMRGSHFPYYLSEDIKLDDTHSEVSVYTQTKGVMNIVYEYINELKKQGLYDDTTIIITADHGAANNARSYYDQEIGRMNGTCLPVMIVKMAGQEGESIAINSAPIYQGNMLATILDVFGLEYEDIAPRLSDIKENDEVVRYFYDSVPIKVVGDAHDVNNWVME